jgi:hypothetical protein
MSNFKVGDRARGRKTYDDYAGEDLDVFGTTGVNTVREFNIGDRVKVVANIGHPRYDCNIGKEFKVLAVDEENVDINAPGLFGDDSSTWHFSELELVGEEEK